MRHQQQRAMARRWDKRQDRQLEQRQREARTRRQRKIDAFIARHVGPTVTVTKDEDVGVVFWTYGAVDGKKK